MPFEEFLKKQPLLEIKPTIILPKDIDFEAYSQVLIGYEYAQFKYPNEVVQLFCCGDGGDGDVALGIVDTILTAKQKTEGVLLGEAASAHSWIWAACHVRLVGQHSRIAIHAGGESFQAPVSNGWVRTDRRDMQLTVDKFVRTDAIVADIYANASVETSEWWLEQMLQGCVSLKRFDAHQLVNELRMAEFA